MPQARPRLHRHKMVYTAHTISQKQKPADSTGMCQPTMVAKNGTKCHNMFQSCTIQSWIAQSRAEGVPGLSQSHFVRGVRSQFRPHTTPSHLLLLVQPTLANKSGERRLGSAQRSTSRAVLAGPTQGTVRSFAPGHLIQEISVQILLSSMMLHCGFRSGMTHLELFGWVTTGRDMPCHGGKTDGPTTRSWMTMLTSLVVLVGFDPQPKGCKHVCGCLWQYNYTRLIIAPKEQLEKPLASDIVTYSLYIVRENARRNFCGLAVSFFSKDSRSELIQGLRMLASPSRIEFQVRPFKTLGQKQKTPLIT